MFRPIRLVAILLICAALLAAMVSPLLQVFAAPRGVPRPPWVPRKVSRLFLIN